VLGFGRLESAGRRMSQLDALENLATIERDIHDSDSFMRAGLFLKKDFAFFE